VIDRSASRQGGALALRRAGNAWEVTAARPRGDVRPWAAGAAAGAARVSVPKSGAAEQRDATPREVDLRADD
jgi:hypothetical protein